MKLNQYEIIGMNLKYYRFTSGKSQEEFYGDLGLNPKYYACVERGEKNLEMKTIMNLANLIGITVNDLILYNKNHYIIKKRIDERTKVKN